MLTAHLLGARLLDSYRLLLRLHAFTICTADGAHNRI